MYVCMRALDPLEHVLQTVVSCQVVLETQPVLLTVKLSFQPLADDSWESVIQ